MNIKRSFVIIIFVMIGCFSAADNYIVLKPELYFEEKEDVLELVQRLLHKIREVVADDGRTLRAVVLDKEDFIDILSIEEGRFANRLIGMIMMTLAFERHHSDEGSSDEIIHPKRVKNSGLEINQKHSQKLDFTLSIRETPSDVTMQLSTADSYSSDRPDPIRSEPRSRDP